MVKTRQRFVSPSVRQSVSQNHGSDELTNLCGVGEVLQSVYDESGGGLAEYIAALGGLVIVVVAVAAPLVRGWVLQAQTNLEIAQSNRILAQGLADVARANANTPLVVAFAVGMLGLAAVMWAVVALVALAMRRRHESTRWEVLPGQARHTSMGRPARPAAAIGTETERQVMLVQPKAIVEESVSVVR